MGYNDTTSIVDIYFLLQYKVTLFYKIGSQVIKNYLITLSNP